MLPIQNSWWENVKRPLGRPRRRWGDDIDVDIKEIGAEDVN